MTTTATAVLLVAAAVCCVSAITTSAKPPAIKTTLQIFPSDPSDADDSQHQQQHLQQWSSFAAGTSRYWQSSAGPSGGQSGSLSPAQQEHILDDVRRHNVAPHQQTNHQWLTAPGGGGSAKATDDDRHRRRHHQQTSTTASTVDDQQLQQLLQINGVSASDNGYDHVDDHVGETVDRQSSTSTTTTTTIASADTFMDDRHRQRSIGGEDWQPQFVGDHRYNNNNNNRLSSPLPPFLSTYMPSSPVPNQSQYHHQQQQQIQQKQQYPQYSQVLSSVSTSQHYPTTKTTSAAATAGPLVSHHHINQNQQTYASSSQQQSKPQQQQQQQQQQQFYQQQTTEYSPTGEAATASIPSDFSVSGNGGDLDADIERQIRQQLTAVSGGGNYTVIPASSLTGGGIGGNRLLQQIASSSSTNVPQQQYVQIGSNAPNRQQQAASSAPGPTVIPAGAPIPSVGKNTIVKTVVVRQKPSTQTTTTTPAPPPPQPQIDQHQLELLARQVLPPGVAQYEIIKGADDLAAVKTATVGGQSDNIIAGPQPQAPGAAVARPRKPVTFVILEEQPDGTVRVRGVKKKGADSNGDVTDSVTEDPAGLNADDGELQKLVDRLNRGEFRLPPSTGSGSSAATDSAPAASATTSAPPVFVTSSISPLSSIIGINNNNNNNKVRGGDLMSPYFTQLQPAVTSQSITHQNQQQNFFLPTAVPTAAVPVTTGHHYHQNHPQPTSVNNNQYQQQQQQYYQPSPTTSAATTVVPTAYTPSFLNVSATTATTIFSNNKDDIESFSFSTQLRRRGYYAMAKYMRQAGIDSVLRETGPFTMFVPTDKAFRALLVQLGGPDRAEDKFRENPRLLIGLLLHHVVPGAFKAADLRAGDEMTGVSLAGTQLRANLYARQLYDNRWNDIEVLTINGARVLDDVPAAGADSDIVDNNGPMPPQQQRRDIILNAGNSNQQQQITAIGHAVDRVLFPLPVGDVVQTMRADRQRRYSVFLRALDIHCSSSVRTLLTGSRTVTVFAPMDEAFRRHGNSSSSSSIADRLLHSDTGNDSTEESVGLSSKKTRQLLRKIADRFILSHIVVAGTGDPPMYTAGLKFYQVRDTAYRLPENGGGAGDVDDGINPTLTVDEGQERPDGTSRYYQLTVYKDSGRIRLNGGAAQVLVRNVPATNGVLHGIDAPLV